MNVLSLFDGMSCGRLALERAGIKVYNYFSSEIDTYCIKVADKNWPRDAKNRLGDVCKINAKELPKIDLLIAGSPCQGFSFAGKQLAFDDPRSKLFFEFVMLKNELTPKYFLLENVRMKKEFQDVISEHLGVEPICINSALVSAQNRVRYYWTNIPGVSQPPDLGIKLQDILENGHSDRLKSFCIDANYYKGGNIDNYLKKNRRQLVFDKPIVFEKPHGANKGGCKNREKFNTLRVCTSGNYALYTGTGFRKLTPIECERLQTVPDNYTDGVSNSQRYKMLGNGWTVDVIAHILSYLTKEHKHND